MQELRTRLRQNERKTRIQQLEEVLHDTVEEAGARAEKIETLEWKLESGRTSDPAAAVAGCHGFCRSAVRITLEFVDRG